MKNIIFILLLSVGISHAQLDVHMPKGLMLNMDFEQVQNGLIPSKTLYPLFIPLDELKLEKFNHRKMLAFQYGDGLNVPHSSLLDPNGDEWIISVRVFPLTDGIIVSQSNEFHGYTIYVRDGHIYAAVRTGNYTFVLQERAETGLTKYTKRWVTVELRVRENMALMNLNRKRVGMVTDEPALNGENLRIRLGNHNTLPKPFTNIEIPSAGFTGAISSFKILRQ